MFEPNPFQVHPALSGPTRQTIGGKLLRARTEKRSGPLRVERERWETPDGDFLDLDLVEPEHPTGDVALILHGLEGSTRRPYVRITLRELARRGVRGVAMNFRTCSGEPNRLPRSYHSGDTGDLRWVLSQLDGARSVSVIGFSLGGNVLLKYLGEEGDAAGISRACAISVPFDLSAGADAIQRGAAGVVYTQYFLRSLKRKVKWKAELLGGDLVQPALAARTIREFDDVLTAPLHGFIDAEDYYARSSSGGFLPQVRVPTLLIQSRDDPFQPQDALPLMSMVENPSIRPLLTDRGGHLGFVGTGNGRSRFFWAEEEAARWVANQL